MTPLYPYNAPIILTDSIYLAYGGQTGNSNTTQRSAAYLIAEEEVSEDLDTLLLPTIVTGTHLYQPLQNYLLDYGYVTRLIQVDLLDVEEKSYFTVDDPSSLYASMLDYERGILGISPYCLGSCSPYKVRAIYETGLPSGTAYHSNILLALTTMANIFLNEIIGYGNEGVGDVGIQNFRNQQYYEERKFLLRTTFGQSAKAQFVHKLLGKFRKYRQSGL